MSFYSDASLVMIPSGYKTSKVYSAVPTDGTGDLAFTRSNATATRVASNGLIEKVRTNLVLQSETFGNASWGKSLVTITDNFDTAPNGTLTADRFVSAGGAFPQISQARTVVSGTQYTASLYVKSDGTTQIAQVIIIGGNTVSFTPTSTWQRISTTFTAASSSATFVLATNSAIAPASSFVIWAAQLETGDIATDYIPTTTAAVSVGPVANVPRLDYLNSTCPKLLLEPQRTNLALFSESFDNAAWTKGGTTISANTSATLDPSGYNGSDKLVEDSSTGVHRVFNNSSVVVSDSVATTYSVFAKAAERTQIYLRDNDIVGARFNLSTGAVISTEGTATATITKYGNGWYRCTITRVNSNTSGRVIVYLDNGGDSYTGNGTSGVYIFGAQIESSAAYATSYIPTLGASVTRGADAASKTGISSLIGQTEGTLFVEMNNVQELDIPEITLDDNTNDNRIVLTRSAVNGFWGIFTASAGTGASGYGTTAGNSGKFALAYSSAGYVLYRNGVQVATATASLPVSLSAVRLNGRSTSDFLSTKSIAQTLLFKTRLTNAQLAELTTI